MAADLPVERLTQAEKEKNAVTQLYSEFNLFSSQLTSDQGNLESAQALVRVMAQLEILGAPPPLDASAYLAYNNAGSVLSNGEKVENPESLFWAAVKEKKVELMRLKAIEEEKTKLKDKIIEAKKVLDDFYFDNRPGGNARPRGIIAAKDLVSTAAELLLMQDKLPDDYEFQSAYRLAGIFLMGSFEEEPNDSHAEHFFQLVKARRAEMATAQINDQLKTALSPE